MKWNETIEEFEYFKKGSKVILKETGEVLTIEKFHANTCGDGCCNGYSVEENHNLYWPDNLEIYGGETHDTF